MRNLLYFMLLILSLSSCVDLNEAPKSSQTTNQFYRNEADAIAAVNAVYHRMFTNTAGMLASGVLFNRQLMMYEMATDDYTAGPRTRNAQIVEMSKLNHSASNLAIEYSWEYTYEAINIANIAIDRIAQIAEGNISDSIRHRLINEAKFLRGWNYFNLVRWHGEVPLVLHETTTLDNEAIHPFQSSEDEIYQQIIRDFTDAESLPKPGEYIGSDIGRATSGAAKAFLIKVWLTRKEWQKAADKAKELIDLKWYDLFENYADVFNPKTKNGMEHIFSEQFEGADGYTSHRLAQTTAPSEAPFNGDYVDAPNHNSGLFESFSENDTRKYVTFAKALTDPATGNVITFSEVHFNKYWDKTTPYNQANSSINVPILRYSDVLLMYAEALNELDDRDGAYAFIDKVRARSKIDSLKVVAPDLSKEAFRDSLFQERRKEFALEYQRWFDLARRGSDEYVKAVKAAGKDNVAARHIHFPIPQRELDLNPNLRQRTDWVNY